MLGTRAVSTTSRFEMSSSIFFLQGMAPKEIHSILTETLTCFLPGRAKDLSAPCTGSQTETPFLRSEHVALLYNDEAYKGKGKVLPTTRHEGTKGKQNYSSVNHYFGAGWWWVVSATLRPVLHSGQCYTPATQPQQRAPLPTVQGAG